MTLSESTSSSTASLGEVRARREDLRHRMVALEEALAAASGSGPAAWWARVQPVIRDLDNEFRHHVAVTEAPDGFLDEVVAEAPHLAPRRAELLREHETIGRALGDLVAAPFLGDAAGVESVRESALSVLGALARHRHRGAEFIYDAYNLDIGASD